MHGDYHIANVLFRADDGGLAAILDWELAAVGDPLLDLGRLTTVWPNEAGEGLLSLKVQPWNGFPSEGELIERYAAKTGRSMAALPWFQVLACYKFAIVLEGIPAPLAARITSSLHVPTIGIGAGPDCDAQVLVWQDMAGLSSGRPAKFVKKFADVGSVLRDAAARFGAEVRAGSYPAPEHEYH